MKYRLTCIVDKELVPTITALIIDRVHSYHVEEVEKPKTNGVERKAYRPASNLKDREWARAAFKLVDEHMRQEPGKTFHYVELGELLPKLGMNPTSISPVMSAMNAEGLVIRCGRGQYRLPSK